MVRNVRGVEEEQGSNQRLGTLLLTFISSSAKIIKTFLGRGGHLNFNQEISRKFGILKTIPGIEQNIE